MQPLPPVNEIVGFLARRAPAQLKAVAQAHPLLEQSGFFSPGVRAGDEKPKPNRNALTSATGAPEENVEILLLKAHLVPVTEMLDKLVVEGAAAKTRIIRDLRSASRLKLVCQILTVISSGSGGALGLAEKPKYAALACLIGLCTSILAVVAQWKETPRGAEALAAEMVSLGQYLFSAKLANDEIRALLPSIALPAVQAQLRTLATSANEYARQLNSTLDKLSDTAEDK
jgi:hypothetical protein